MRIGWQLFGAGERTLLLLPTWSIVHSDFWRHQVDHFSRRYTVVAFDGRGNGASDRPSEAAAYADQEFADDALAVLDAVGIDRAAALSVSMGAQWGLLLAAEHPKRVPASVFIAPSLPLTPPLVARAPSLAAKLVFLIAFSVLIPTAIVNWKAALVRKKLLLRANDLERRTAQSGSA